VTATLPGRTGKSSPDGVVAETAFRAAMADLPAAVSIVTTTAADGEPHGATVSAVSSLSLRPALILVCLDQQSDTLAALAEGRHFLVHITADGQQDLITRFAGKGTDKFGGDHWAIGLSGQPQLPGATASSPICSPAGTTPSSSAASPRSSTTSPAPPSSTTGAG
jgi:flavin reductase (DIM6/NTAB) family NADH-FMN oxidoreductase RutF